MPAREAARRDVRRVPLLACATWPVPRGPVVRAPRRGRPRLPAIVHVHGLASLVPWSPFLGDWPRAAVVASLHGVLDRHLATGRRGPRRWWHEQVDTRLLRRLAGVHATRASEASTARPFVAPGAVVERIPWPLADAPPPRPARRASSAPFVLFVGRLHPIKGVDRLLPAFATVAARRRDLRLVLAGDGSRGYLRSLLQEARRAGIRDRVEVLGWVGPEALAALHAEATALVLPSRYESLGMSAVEALRAGCPVVASRETPWDALETAAAGRWVDFDSPTDVAAALEDVAGRREASGAAARALYEAEHATSRVVPRFVAWYERVMRAVAAARPPDPPSP